MWNIKEEVKIVIPLAEALALNHADLLPNSGPPMPSIHHFQDLKTVSLPYVRVTMQSSTPDNNTQFLLPEVPILMGSTQSNARPAAGSTRQC